MRGLQTWWVDNEVYGIAIHHKGEPMSVTEVLAAWRDDAAFRAFWLDALRCVPFDAYGWEMPALTRDAAGRPFGCVCVAIPALGQRAADPAPFAGYFRDAGQAPVTAFDNLGGDAHLVVPTPRTEEANGYAHLAVFVRHAPEHQAQALWRVVAEAVGQRLGPRPLWLNTAGLGVPWLHVRIDARPKYYRYRPYAHSV